jgi:HlyD family type I secretion membrane fusion protein
MQIAAAAPRLWYADVPRRSSLATALGMSIIVAALLSFGVWAATAPLAGAVVTSGAFVATGQNKIIQNFEGGIIKEILVKEGDTVEKGQDLVLLDETAVRAELQRFLLKELRLRLTEIRLQAEIDQASPPSNESSGKSNNFETAMNKAATAFYDSPEADAIRANQRLILETHLRSLSSEVLGLEKTILSLQDHLQGIELQLKATNQQISLFQEEIDSKNYLFAHGMMKRSEMLALLRARTVLEGEVGRLKGDIGDTEEKIAKAQEQIMATRNSAVKTAVEQIQDVRAELYDTRERISTASDVVSRSHIKAPVRGAVVKLGYHTNGGVIESGKAIMEILPLNDELLIEARVRPQDIENVKKGAESMVRLSALSARVTPMIAGEVVYVSADALQEDARADRSTQVYLVHIRLNTAAVADLENFVPTPGMPAEVYIKTSERTFLNYLLRPIHDSMRRAFREK